MEMMYIKKGRRYIPIEPFTGFPADGIWLVRRNGKSSILTTYIDDLDGCDLRVVAELSKKFDAIENILLERYSGRSAHDMARDLVVLLSKMEPEVSDASDGKAW